MANDVLTQARRAAKTMSRSGDLSYQQSLDAVARQAGHGTWKAMTLANRDAAADQTEEPRVVARTVPVDAGWRIRTLERIEGSRHQPFDEYGIRMMGRPIARMTSIIGLPVEISALLVPAIVMAMAMYAFDDMPGDMTMFVAFMLATTPCMVATLRNPDHRGARRLRRNARVLTMFIITLAAAVALVSATRYQSSFVEALIYSGRLAYMSCAFSLSMWMAAWEGRRRRRDAGADGSGRIMA